MRILEIRLHNLNSLYGTWRLDFSAPAFAADGIFAVTGPTGAGKSTILDAICLALYGRTPRLGRISGANEIMSRGSGDCYAEVHFATQKGRFRCLWSQKRARKQANGKLQAPQHELSDAGSGRILAVKAAEVAAQVEAVTGMDFDRFTRSMLLAQGGFAAFLQAQPGERAQVLEQLTGTAIYSDISKRVHERTQEEKRKLDLLRAEAAGIAPLAPEEAAALMARLKEMQQAEEKQAARHAALAAALAWRNTLGLLIEELARLDRKAALLEEEARAFAPARARLQAALRAAALDGIFAALRAARAEEKRDEEARRKRQAALFGLAQAVRRRAEAERQALAAYEQTQHMMAEAEPLLQSVRALDVKLMGLRAEEARENELCRKARLEIMEKVQARQKKRRERALTEDRSRECARLLAADTAGARLEQELSGLAERLKILALREEELGLQEKTRQTAEDALSQAQKAALQAESACQQSECAERAAAVRLQEEREALQRILGERLLREYRAEKEGLLRELAYERKIAALEAYRAGLEAGKPCPLCGATTHPFAAGQRPVPDALEERIATLSGLIARAEQYEGTCRKFEKEASEAAFASQKARSRQEQAAKERRRAETLLGRAAEELAKKQAALAREQEALTVLLAPFDLQERLDADKILRVLRARLARWREQKENERVLQEKQNVLAGELTRLDGVIKTQSAALAAQKKQEKILHAALEAHRAERVRLFGAEAPEEKERALRAALVQAESVRNRALNETRMAREAWRAVMADICTLKARQGERAPELARLEHELALGLLQAGFADEAGCCAAALPVAEREALARQARALEARQTEIQAMRQDRAARLALEQEKNLSCQTSKELEAALSAGEEVLRALREELAGLKCQLKEDAAAQERLGARREAAALQEKEYLRWAALHELIGSADGKKYRSFAQGLTFELLLQHANRQLARLSERYLLLRSPEEPLSLNVIDNYQAGEVRSAKNLSGGESFLASLALALGLSHMASRNVRVDSLFLDEGFGSLDEDSLETALEVLAGLRREGKLIGLISHVPALRERIPLRIRVRPLAGGRSALSGPGCTAL